MTMQATKTISFPNKNNERTLSQVNFKTSQIHINDFLSKLAEDPSIQAQMSQRQNTCLAEIYILRQESKWEEIVELFYPLEEKEPELIQFNFDIALRREIAFALSQLKRFDEAIKEFKHCLTQDPNNFHYLSGLGFVLYNSLYAAKNKEIILTPQEKKERIKKAHQYLRKAQEIRPDRVTSYYRQAMLYKHIQNKPNKALPLFQLAVQNWEKYSQQQKQTRHHEYKNYIKSLYNLASCQTEKKQYKQAIQSIKKCIQEDKNTDYIHCKHKYFALGKVYLYLNQLDKAKEALEFALTFTDCEDGDYIFELLARTLLIQGKAQNALEIINKIPVRKRRHFVIWTLADILVSLGKKDQAKQELINSSQRDRRSKHRSFIRLCKIAFQEKNYNESLKWAQKADKFHLETYNSHDSDALFWSAASYLQLNQKEKAKQIVSELSVFRPNYPLLSKLRQAI